MNHRTFRYYVTGEIRLIHQHQKVNGWLPPDNWTTAWSQNSHRNKGGIRPGHASCDVNTVNPTGSQMSNLTARKD